MTDDGDSVETPFHGGVVPEDFPRPCGVATVPGTQPKFNANFVGGRFIVGASEEELHVRHADCAEYVRVLPAHCRQLLAGQADLSTDKVLERVGRALARRHHWMSGPEINWVIANVALELDWKWTGTLLWRT
ncbi:hypothetical protein AAFF27_10970 [Xylophilus sp. GW821-FHT01B05]